MNHLTYAPLDLDFPQALLNQLRHEADAAKLRFHSPYRTCEMIPVFTPGGSEDREQIRSSRSELAWTPSTMNMPRLRELIETRFFPIMDPLPRILILVTPPGGEVKIHIDCSRDKVNENQLKLRVVLGGDRTGLWFSGEGGHRRFIDGRHPCYVLDGSHPHGMYNRSGGTKFTLCLGAPWNGEGNDRFRTLLTASLEKFPGSVIWRQEIGRPLDSGLFQDVIEARLQSGAPDPRL